MFSIFTKSKPKPPSTPPPPVKEKRSESKVTKSEEDASTEAKDESTAKGLIRKLFDGITGGDAWPQPKLDEEESKDDDTDDTDDKANRIASGRAADGLMTAEQHRRMSETAKERNEAAIAEAKERQRMAAQVKAVEEAERMRRMVEKVGLPMESNEVEEKEKGQTRARALSAAEQNRRIAEAAAMRAASRAEEEEDHKRSLAMVKAAEEAERQRRIDERTGGENDRIIHQREMHERKKSLDMVWVMTEAERARRMGELALEKSPTDFESQEAMMEWLEREEEHERTRRMSAGRSTMPSIFAH